MSSEAIEDYLKTIYELQGEDGKVSTSMLAARLGLAPPSVTGMLKKLAAQAAVVSPIPNTSCKAPPNLVVNN